MKTNMLSVQQAMGKKMLERHNDTMAATLGFPYWNYLEDTRVPKIFNENHVKNYPNVFTRANSLNGWYSPFDSFKRIRDGNNITDQSEAKGFEVVKPLHYINQTTGHLMASQFKSEAALDVSEMYTSFQNEEVFSAEHIKKHPNISQTVLLTGWNYAKSTPMPFPGKKLNYTHLSNFGNRLLDNPHNNVHRHLGGVMDYIETAGYHRYKSFTASFTSSMSFKKQLI